ncbi:MAG: methyltransferase domain-containing protein [Bacillota bacterium]|nr:methyltransferase domain-containing protein [Bacillota bacterium]
MSRLFSTWYDTLMGPLERRSFKRIRINLLSKASGKVLELGSGTGINFPLYHSLESVTAIEPSTYMIEKSIQKKQKSLIPIEIVHASAERLPFPDNTFDTVIGTLVFCTIPNVEKAIEEMKRVCKPEGRILLFEHVRMGNSILAHLQDWLTPFWKKICDGCCLNRNTVQVLKENGLEIVQLETYFKDLFVVAELIKQDKIY